MKEILTDGSEIMNTIEQKKDHEYVTGLVNELLKVVLQAEQNFPQEVTQ